MAGIKGTTLTVISPPDILKLKLDSAASRLQGVADGGGRERARGAAEHPRHRVAERQGPARRSLRVTRETRFGEGAGVMATVKPIKSIMTAADFCEHCRPKAISLMRAMAEFLEELSASEPEPTTTPDDTLRDAGISSKRQDRYQRRMRHTLSTGSAAIA